MLPSCESVLAGQSKHIDAAVVFWYLPAEHCRHGPDPFTPLYLPALHALHADPSNPSNPGRQTQYSIPSLPNCEWVFAGHCRHTEPPVAFRYVPAAQSEHDPDPFTPLYLPCGHAEHADPSEPSNPTWQVQSVMSPFGSRQFVYFHGDPSDHRELGLDVSLMPIHMLCVPNWNA